MAKQTLLEIVQDILNDIDGDEVNSIDDTPEATQVAFIVRSTYNAMLANRDWPHTKQLIQLSSFSDNTMPTHVTIQSSIKRLLFINYNKQEAGTTRLKYEAVKYKEPEEFLRMVNLRNNDDSNVDVITDPTGVVLNLYNDRHPTYFTSFDEETLVFDSYDGAIDNTIQTSKIQAFAYVIPDFTLSDTHTPDLPEEAFPALVEEAKSRVAAKLRQVADPKSEQESRRQQRWLSRNAWTVAGGVKRPNYGRNSRK
jgi:hypothetical protein